MSFFREAGIITAATEDASHIQTVWVQVDYSVGGTQGFGGLVLQEEVYLESYKTGLCAAFGVQSLAGLVGKRCFALKILGEYQESIEGLESVDTGNQFTHTGWRRSAGLSHETPQEWTNEQSQEPEDGHTWWERLE